MARVRCDCYAAATAGRICRVERHIQEGTDLGVCLTCQVPGAHVAALSASGALPPSAPSAAAIAAPLSQPLLAGG